jgi:ribose transport system permease protein
LEATAPVGIIALGETLVIVTGGIDLSVGAVMGLAGVVAARLMTQGYGPIPVLPMPVSLLLGVLAGGLCGLVNGLLIVGCRMPPFIATLGMFSAARGLAYYIVGSLIGSLPAAYLFLGKGALLGLPVPVVVMLVLGGAAGLWAARSGTGRHVYAIGGSELAARLSGVAVGRVKVGVYTFAGLMSGLAGVLLTAYLGNAQGNQGETLELDVIAAVVVGGVSLSGGEGSILGALLGALLMRILRNGLVLQGVQAEYQLVVLGLVIWLASVVDTLRAGRWGVGSWGRKVVGS